MCLNYKHRAPHKNAQRIQISFDCAAQDAHRERAFNELVGAAFFLLYDVCDADSGITKLCGIADEQQREA